MPAPAHVATRARVDRARAKNTIVATAPDLAGRSDAEIDAALAAVNQDAVYDEQRAAWTTQVWDRTSPINGVPAEHFLARDDVGPTGDIYLLIRDGQVVMFQPHEPGVAGIVRVPKGRGLTRGNSHADEIAADGAAAETTRRVIARLRGTP